MITKPISHRALLCLPVILFLLISFSSCKRDDTNKPALTLKLSNATYNWGDLTLSKPIQSDEVKYNTTGNIGRVITTDNNGKTLSDISLTYSGSKITLNTQYNDEYDLDNSGKVAYHSLHDVQQGHNIVEIERYSYDNADYLNKITMSLIFDDGPETFYSQIDYVVQNGNYTKFTLSNTDSGTVTRQYVFKYNNGKKVSTPVSFFAPVFANNSQSNIDKYLNYGKSSVNLLTEVNYTILNLDKKISTGTFNVATNVDPYGYITSLNLVGNDISGLPSDNISPLPRSVNFILK
jgi:hypothetical protein